MRLAGRTALTILVGLVLFVGMACGNNDSSDDSAAEQAAGTPTAPDPNVLAQQAADAIDAVKSFHFLVNHENGGTPIVLNLLMTRAEGDIVKPDRLQADVEARATQLGNANVKVKVVNVGDATKVTNPFNTRDWVTLPGQNRLADIFDPGAGTTAALRSAKDLKITGEETLNGVKVWRLEGTVDSAELSAVASTIAEPGYQAKGIVWIGQTTPLVHRVRLEGPLGSKDPQNIVRIIELSKFDENVTIELPSS